MPFIGKDVRKITHGNGSGRVLGSEHPSTGSQYFTVQRFGLRKVILMMQGDCQHRQRLHRLWVIRPPDTALDVKRGTKHFLGISCVALVKKYGGQVILRS